MDFLVLGPVTVHQDGEALPVGGSKQRSILALLVANIRHPVSLDRIVDSVYGEDARGGARHSVQTFISTIRRNLGDVVQKEGGGYVLAVDPESIDAVRFETTARAALASLADDPDGTATSLREALAMWRGHPYADVDGRAVFEPEITRLEELRLSVLEGRIDADLASGRHRELGGELEALTVEYPLRERFRAQQMVALYRSGRQTEALRAYERTRTHLGDEIGIEPTSELRLLEQQILDHDPDLDLAVTPSVTERAVVVVEVADTGSLARLDPAQRTILMDSVAGPVAAAVARHGGEGFAQRGAAFYAAFAAIGDAVATVNEVVAVSGSGGSVRSRIAVDFGDVELHDSGEVTGPPVRRSAGMVAAAHPGQVLLSTEAHRALIATGESGWQTRSLGAHPISGMDVPQQVFQLVFEGQEARFPELSIDTAPPPLPTDRRAVAGYELRGPVASDLAGTTYRAYQPSVGREVVVTVIDPAWANEADFVRRFEVETQLVARLHHPNIVPVLDYWRDPTGAYLVAPRVEGASLAEVLNDRALDDEQRRRVIMQVGSALAYAHHAGVVHGNVSPDAVALDDPGNAYLTGAGFVVSLAGAPRASSRFVAPELGRGEPVTAAADVWSVGALAGHLFDGGALPEKVAQLFAEATADLPDRRIASMEEFLSEFGAAFGQQEPQVSFTTSRNPYKGLEAFTEADAADFFGRSDSVEELAAMLAEHRLVAVVGPSGSGKSSLVKAGLIPAVRTGAVDGSRRWVVTDMFPGSYPFVELESALARVAVTDPGSVLDELDRDERGLLRMIKRILPGDTRLLLVIDQFEEVFTLTRDDNTRSAFLDALVTLAADEHSDTRVLITLRADFFDRPLRHPEFGGMLRAGMFALTTPTAERLGDAVRSPAEAVGVGWEAGLSHKIVADVTDEPGTLPLLQYALTELFASRDADRLTHDGYRATGGVLGALGIRADGVFEQLDRGKQDVARQLLLRLVTVRSSREQTRRRARMVELNAVAEPGDVDAVLTAFGDARLLTFDRDPVTRGPTVEVAHEALLTHWPRLADWIIEAREDLLLHQRLADAVDEWVEHDRDESYLLAGGRLAQFAAWAGSSDLALTELEGEYLELSGKRSEEQRTRRRRIRNLVTVGFAAAAVIGLVLATFAFISRQNAAANAELARSRELAASAINVLDKDPELSLLLALEGASSSDPPIESVSAVHEALANHRKILTYNWPPQRERNNDLDARLSPDGHTLVAAAGSNYVEVVDVDSGERLWNREFPGNGRARAAFTPDGSNVVVGYGWIAAPGMPRPDRATESALGVHLLDMRTGESIRHFPVGPCGLVTAEMYVVEVAGAASLVAGIPRDSNCTFSGDEFGPSFPPVSLLDLDTGEIELLADRSDHVYLTPDARYLMFQEPNDGPVVVIDRRENRQIAAFDGTAGAEGISADGSLALTWSLDQEPALDVWDLTSGQAGEPIATIDGFEGWFTPGGDALWVNALFDAVPVQLWDLQTGERADELLAGLASAWQLTQSNDGSRVLVNERGDSAVVFELEASTGVSSMRLCREFDGQTGEVEVAGQIASVYGGCENDGSLGTQFVVDLDAYALRASIPHQAGTSALSLDGRLLATQIGEPPATLGRAVLRDTTDGAVSKTMEGLCTWIEGEPGPECAEFPETPYPDWPWDFAFSPDGELLAMAGQYTDGVTVWDAETGLIVAQPTVTHDSAEPYQTLDVEFSPEGEHMVVSFFVGGPPELWLLSTDDWAPVGRYEATDDAEGEDAPVAGLVFTPDGELLVGTDFSVFGQGQIVFMDGSTLAHIDRISDAHDGGINDLAINAEGTLLASAGVDGFVRVWDIETRTVVHQIPISNVGGVGGVAFLESGEHLAASSQADGELRIVALDTGELLDIARTRLTRTFTETECATYRIDPCPTLGEIKAG